MTRSSTIQPTAVRDVVIYVIDKSSSRRAAVTHALDRQHLHAVPIDSLIEARLDEGRPHLLLVNDDEALLAAFMEDATALPFPPVFAIYAENPVLHRATRLVREGACDYLAWPTPSEALHGLVEIAVARANISADDPLRRSAVAKRLALLTDRERDVLDGLVRGLSSRGIGQKLNISRRTVEVHRANMLRKLQADDTRTATRMAMDHGFLNT